MIYAVIDTNVLVSALLSHRDDAATVQVITAVLEGRIVPLWHRDILEEYREVLARPKFRFRHADVEALVSAFQCAGREVEPAPTGEMLPDMDDLIFYEVVMEKRADNARLVTGNLKHYPAREFIVTPAEMMEILENEADSH